MGPTEIDKLRKEARKVMSGKDLDKTLSALDLLEKSNKELERRGGSVSQSHKVNTTLNFSERELPGLLQSLKELYILKYGSKESKDNLLAELETKRANEDAFVESIQNNFNNPQYQKRIKSAFKRRKILFRGLVIVLLIFSAFLFAFLKKNNIENE